MDGKLEVLRDRDDWTGKLEAVGDRDDITEVGSLWSSQGKGNAAAKKKRPNAGTESDEYMDEDSDSDGDVPQAKKRAKKASKGSMQQQIFDAVLQYQQVFGIKTGVNKEVLGELVKDKMTPPQFKVALGNLGRRAEWFNGYRWERNGDMYRVELTLEEQNEADAFTKKKVDKEAAEEAERLRSVAEKGQAEATNQAEASEPAEVALNRKKAADDLAKKKAAEKGQADPGPAAGPFAAGLSAGSSPDACDVSTL